MTYTSHTARAAALTRWATETNRTAGTQRARDARRARYADRVDPDRTLTDQDRDARIDMLVRADMITLAARRKGVRR